MPFTVALCDDDAEQIKYIRELLKNWADERNVELRTAAYSGAEQFLFEYPGHPCDLLLLDIEMGGLSGMDLAKKLRSEQDMLPIIFVTGFSEYISEGYDVEALHYLLKPIDREKLYGVLDKYISRNPVKTEEILIKSNGAFTHLSAERIVCVEAFGRGAELTLADGTVLPCDQGIRHFENLQGFFHCHRSYLVNMRYVKSIGKTAVFLDTGAEVPLSRRLYKEVNRRFILFYQGRLPEDAEHRST